MKSLSEVRDARLNSELDSIDKRLSEEPLKVIRTNYRFAYLAEEIEYLRGIYFEYLYQSPSN